MLFFFQAGINSSSLNQVSFFTYLPFSLASAISTGLTPDAYLSAHWRPLLNCLHMVIFFYWPQSPPIISKGNHSLWKPQQAASPLHSKIGTLNWATLNLLTFALGIQTNSGTVRTLAAELPVCITALWESPTPLACFFLLPELPFPFPCRAIILINYSS